MLVTVTVHVLHITIEGRTNEIDVWTKELVVTS